MSTETTLSAGGFTGDPLAALNAPAAAGGCCGSSVAAEAPQAGGCCGTAPAAQATSGCCGTQAAEAPKSSGCCG